MISVVIVTRNRSIELRTISLRSLLKQDHRDFEVIVWDASDGDLSLLVVNEMGPGFKEKGIHLAYYRAPRIGSASQRNDSVKVARGNFIFFIDDDSEVSPDGIRCLQECIDKYPDARGAALPVAEEAGGEAPFPSVVISDRIKDWLYPRIGYRRKRVVQPSGSAKGFFALSGPAEWLSGCSMGFRKEVFDSLEFNEDLETFSHYALGEDIEFSHRVFLRYGQPLRLAERGKVIHRPSPKARFSTTEKLVATKFYSRYLIMRVASVRSPALGRIGFGWNFLKDLFKMSFSTGIMPTYKGLSMAFRVFGENRKDKKFSRNEDDR